jgi:predicted DNA-binding protein
MKKLTSDQRHYRKRKKLARRDFIFVPRPHSDKRSVQVTRRAICIRISSDVFELLDRLCEHYGKTKQDMVTHMINHSIEQYQGLDSSQSRLRRYSWPEELLNGQPEHRRYAKNTQKQINIRITSTAYKKLQCHCVDRNVSKKRVVQQLINAYAHRVLL